MTETGDPGRGDMTTSQDSESSIIAALLQRWSKGDKEALDQLATHLYRDIHAIAVRELRNERQLTIRPTALVNEAYMRLAGLNKMQWQDRAHFLSMAARVTRQALVDEARQRRAGKRDGGSPVTLSDENLGSSDTPYDALDVDALLKELETFDAVAAEVVSLRIFGGLSIEEAAEALSVSVATVNRRWATGKAWLTRELIRNA
jgi:RNA polymerase sigma factor (TIGR02999 family)